MAPLPLPAHLLLLPALLFLLLLAVADALPPSCSNVTCGGHVVQYPFSLHESDCGYPGLDLLCEKNTTLILSVKFHRYRVVRIDYQAHTVAVSDADVDGAEYSTICPRLHANLTIDYTSSWLQPAPADSNITFLYNCSKSVSSSSAAVELIGCRGDDDDKRSYVLPDGVVTGAEAYKYECEEVVVAPVLGLHKEWMTGTTPGTGSPAPAASGSFGVGDVVRAGFELNYDVHSQQCRGCEQSGGWCGYRHNQTNGGMNFTCFCDGGPTAARCGKRLGRIKRSDRSTKQHATPLVTSSRTWKARKVVGYFRFSS